MFAPLKEVSMFPAYLKKEFFSSIDRNHPAILQTWIAIVTVSNNLFSFYFI